MLSWLLWYLLLFIAISLDMFHAQLGRCCCCWRSGRRARWAHMGGPGGPQPPSGATLATSAQGGQQAPGRVPADSDAG